MTSSEEYGPLKREAPDQSSWSTPEGLERQSSSWPRGKAVAPSEEGPCISMPEAPDLEATATLDGHGGYKFWNTIGI